MRLLVNETSNVISENVAQMMPRVIFRQRLSDAQNMKACGNPYDQFFHESNQPFNEDAYNIADSWSHRLWLGLPRSLIPMYIKISSLMGRQQDGIEEPEEKLNCV